MNRRINIKTMKETAVVPNMIINVDMVMISPGFRGIPVTQRGETISLTCEKTIPNPPSVIAVVAIAIAQAAPPLLEDACGGAVSSNGLVSINLSPQPLQYLNPGVASTPQVEQYI